MLSYKKSGSITVREYETAQGQSPFGRWFATLDAIAAAKIVKEIEKISGGNFSGAKPVGEGVSEHKLDWGPGYRIYFSQDGQTLVILLGGGTKKRQSQDIAAAKVAWADYKKRKREEYGTAQQGNRNSKKRR